MIEAILIAIAICIDSLALGITYGVRKIKIPHFAILIINIISTLVLGITVLAGQMISQFFSAFTATLLSSIILISLGSFFMLESYIKYLISTKQAENSECSVLNVKISKLGIIINIALDVTKADMDVSGDINTKEAFYIGFILSLDSLGAGFGYAISDINILFFLTSVFIINLLSLSSGLLIGRKITHRKNNLFTSLLPSVILITIGILKWFH